ncbi:MAG: peptidoglycan DD-metalloendopeptidase family protein [Gallionella sp.]
MSIKYFVILFFVAVTLAACSTDRYRAPGYERGVSGQTASTGEKDWRPQVYVVQKGDTMYGIAFNYGFDYHELSELNGIKDPSVISVGQKIRLFPGQTTSDGIAIKPIKNLLKGQPKLVKYRYSEKALAMADKIQDIASPVVATIASADKSKPKIVKQAPVKNVNTGNDANLKWAMPAKGKIIAKFSAAANRKGIDISGTLGQPVHASAPGKVVYSGSGLRGYGKLVIIKHNSTFLSAYAHNNQILVKEGEKISQGQKIAEMGSTDADRVKLHFEIRRLGKPVDPFKYIPAVQL